MASNTVNYEYLWPLDGFGNAPPVPDDPSDTYKSHSKSATSRAYDEFQDPLDRGERGGFDAHIYYFQQNEEQTNYARALRERIVREFPELKVNRFWNKPVGPHPTAMFAVIIFTPAQFGAFISWLAIWRGPLLVLIHPNTIEPGVDRDVSELRDHTERATWMGERLPLDVGYFHQVIKAKAGKEIV